MNGMNEEEWEDEERLVRPYALTGGRTRSQSGEDDLPIEALICPTVAASSAKAHGSGIALERVRILEMCDRELLSVAELSARLHLPIGVIRVLASDLMNERLVTASTTRNASVVAATNLDLLESVLNGIAAL